MLFALVAAAGLMLNQDTDTTFAVRQGQRLEVSDFGGSVVIKSWRQGSVRVRATHGSRDRVTVSTEGATVSISASSRHGPAMVDYEILAPAWMPISVSGSPSAEVTIEGSEAEIAVETVEGAVTVIGGRGNIALKSVEGEVSLTGAKGHIELNSVDGSITVKDCSGDITAATVDGEISLLDIESSDVDASTVDGSIEYDGTITDGGRYRLTSHDGDVSVSMPERANASISVATFSGSFDSYLAVTLGPGQKSKHRFTFTLGSGGARVELESFDGSIRLVRPGQIHQQNEE
ncbi:MAG TPA: DUF4097 family beta strand repeat-containing protein [Gemmatimonadales bacterium]|nr:DUF4097 family beta strand repeat-containing protein [Gemmatimonadales bacterium]